MDIHTNIALAQLHHADRLAAADTERRARAATTSRRRARPWGGRTRGRRLAPAAALGTADPQPRRLVLGR